MDRYLNPKEKAYYPEWLEKQEIRRAELAEQRKNREILSFDENRVMLYDFQIPLFNKEFIREEFDRRARENPMNDHLKVIVPVEEKTDTTDHAPDDVN